MDPGRIAFGLRGIATELKERLLAVPVYQRSYAWTTDEIGEYWAGLERSVLRQRTRVLFGHDRADEVIILIFTRDDH